MGKQNQNKRTKMDAAATTRADSSNSATTQNTTKPAASRVLSELRNDRDLWFKICVLVYDLGNMRKDKHCENRTLQTTDALYISAPYFSDEEAAIVKEAMLDTGITVAQAISSNLENFFEKRKASGDSRPCGPHDMMPVYLSVLGIDKAELKDEKFVSRVRRSGLGGS